MGLKVTGCREVDVGEREEIELLGARLLGRSSISAVRFVKHHSVAIKPDILAISVVVASTAAKTVTAILYLGFCSTTQPALSIC